MATINNSSLSKELIDGAKIQISYDKVPNQLADKVVPVMEVNPKMLRRLNVLVSGNRSAASALTIYTTPAISDFYLTSITASFIKDVLNDHSTGGASLVNATINGVVTGILQAPVITLTAQSGVLTLNLPYPIKIDNGTNIQIAGVTVGAGTFVRTATIAGYIVDN